MSRPNKTIPLLKIHQALASVPLADAAAVEEIMGGESPGGSMDVVESLLANDQAANGFHELLHEYCMFARPKDETEVKNLASLVSKIIQACGTHKVSWKVFTLAAFLRRYHDKAPEARFEQKSLTDMGDSSYDGSVGDGERLIFYVTLLALHQHGGKRNDLAQHAATALVRAAARVGGTRDLCAIIEHLTLARLWAWKEDNKQDGIVGGDGPPAVFAEKLVPAVHAMAIQDDVQADPLLDLALTFAAKQLDDDLILLKAKPDAEKDKDLVLLSTIHVKLPHNGRGSNGADAWERKLANCVAEIMLWNKTVAAKTDERFLKAWTKLEALPSTAVEQGHALIQQMQTTARKQRQLLNQHARQQGFLLTSSYMLDKTSITLRQVRRAKAGDLKLLENLARKHADARVLNLIAKRNFDPNKVTTVESIGELISTWMDITQADKDGGDEILALELVAQAKTVEATLKKLKCQSDRAVWVTCVGLQIENLVCAILVAASLESSKLLLGGEQYDVSTPESCVALLNDTIMNRTFSPIAGKGPSIPDMLKTKVEPSQDVLILSSSDLELNEDILQSAQERDIAIRVHSTQKVEKQEKASLSLNSRIYDRIRAGESLSLGVMLDCTGSMGGEIEGCKKGALEMISTFQGLAPVGKVNVMGYWDPISVLSDPQPRSTGYLDATDENMAAIKQFVNTQLECRGGGDEPEDIPEALERYIEDSKAVGLSADKGVHFLFFIADAGFRFKENARVVSALDTLKKMGIIMVMCKVRGHGTLQTMVLRAKDCFQGVGQFIELNGVGQLAAIAASVTESIRASLFQESSVVSVTASVGSTIESIRKLAAFQKDHASLKKTEELAKMEVEEEDEKKEEATSEKPKVYAEKKEFKLTSRDRLYLQLSRLPQVCHNEIVTAFGGKTLQELAAAEIADRLREDDIPISEIQTAGYPKEIVAMVQNVLAGYGMERVED